MKLVVGLGNPGSQYAETRHNIGFDVIDQLAAKFAASRPKKKFQGELCEAVVGTERVLFLMPLTFMNLSGSSVLVCRDFHKILPEDTLVVCDDLALPVGRLRFRGHGSAGGQKGLADVIRRLGTDQVPRLRIGIGQCPPGWDAADYVLGKFTSEEKPVVQSAVTKGVAGVADWIARGLQYCMNHYNADEPKKKDSGPAAEK